MDLCCLVNARNAYSYPPGRVTLPAGLALSFASIVFDVPTGPRMGSLPSSISLDHYHNHLLTSASSDDVLLGIASVQYWGRCYSNRHVNHNQAHVRTEWLFHGNARSHGVIGINDVARVRQALTYIHAGRIGDAYWAIRDIPHIGPSYGSKLLAFLAPDQIGVYDSHIARYVIDNLAVINSLAGGAIVANVSVPTPTAYRTHNMVPFANYCAALQVIAARLNAAGSRYCWQDWDQSRQSWRAVDVERAFFYIAQNNLTSFCVAGQGPCLNQGLQ